MCVCVCSVGVYTAYKPYLNKDEEIIKQLQKVRYFPFLSIPLFIIENMKYFYVFSCFAGCSTEETLCSPECNSSALLLRTDTKLHHSTGNSQLLYVCGILQSDPRTL